MMAHSRLLRMQAAVKARVRNAAAISPKVECEYQRSGPVIITTTAAIARGVDLVLFSVRKVRKIEPTKARKLR
jgi:hypothetical protein